MSNFDLSRAANYIVLREQGKTYQEIGNMYGVSKQCVEQAIKTAELRFGGRCRRGSVDIAKIAYNGIYNLFVNDESMTFSKIARKCTNNPNRSMVQAIQGLFEGKNTKVSINFIKNLIKISGMTFEELFEPRNVGEQE